MFSEGVCRQTEVCFADDQGCVRMSCVSARSGGACPVAHLYDFRSQEQPTELAEPSERLTSARERERGKTFLWLGQHE